MVAGSGTFETFLHLAGELTSTTSSIDEVARGLIDDTTVELDGQAEASSTISSFALHSFS